MEECEAVWLASQYLHDSGFLASIEYESMHVLSQLKTVWEETYINMDYQRVVVVCTVSPHVYMYYMV